MLNKFFENVNLSNEISYLSMQYDGIFVIRECHADEHLVNRFLIPKQRKLQEKLKRKVIHLIRKGKAAKFPFHNPLNPSSLIIVLEACNTERYFLWLFW
jgi:hypothetical protein